MKEEELIKVLKEFDKKRVEQLNDNARNLFNAIMDIANQRDKLLEEKQELIDYLKEELKKLEINRMDFSIDYYVDRKAFLNEILSKIEKNDK